MLMFLYNSPCNSASPAPAAAASRALDMFVQLEEMKLSLHNSPLEQEEVDIIVALCEEVSQNTGGITTADLIGWQPKVDALDKIPHLSDCVLTETSMKGRKQRQLLNWKKNAAGFLTLKSKKKKKMHKYIGRHAVRCILSFKLIRMIHLSSHVS